MSERFGARLRRLRLAAPPSGPTRPHLAGTRWDAGGHLSLAALAHLARIDPSHVHRLEQGTHGTSRAVVLRLADALGCSEHERALLLADAGFWPWPDADDGETTLLVALGEAVMDGDYRALERPAIDGSRAMHQQV